MKIINYLFKNVLYVGIQYEMITTDIRKPIPKSLSEISDYDYKLVFCNSTDFGYCLSSQLIQESLAEYDLFDLRHQLKVVEGSEYFINNFPFSDNEEIKSCDLIFGSHEKSVYWTDLPFYWMIFSKCGRKPITINDELNSFPKTVILQGGEFILSELENVIQLIGSSGLLQYYVKYNHWYTYLRKPIHSTFSKAKVFSLDDLFFGFVPWFSACCFSIVVFWLENVYFLLSVALKNVSHIIISAAKIFFDRLVNSLKIFNLKRFLRRIQIFMTKNVETIRKVFRGKYVNLRIKRRPLNLKSKFRHQSLLQKMALILKRRPKT
jgi:hypothetical protein